MRKTRAFTTTVKMSKFSKSHNCCILCLKSPLKVPYLRLHQFPTNEEKRNIWLNACGLQADEYSPNRKLCSRHFDEPCYSKCGYRLKSDAIPTKYLKGQIIRPYFQLPEYKLKNDELLSSLQPSKSETVNVNSKLKQCI
ncbi:uncharacterized protein LOC132942059 [Metopolophium dirhodum]|uniref:uncharacterized protein LOC132942059 n=1 Tax=Metopolophium dirhodum TaxID=44670 RepID=UPI002990651D|nr:uncharacterized protein LOC132942059 [Metopolophium dirhodum]